MSIFDNYSSLARSLGLRRDINNVFLPPGFKSPIADTPEQMRSVFNMFTRSLQNRGPAVSSFLERNYQKISDDYAAAALLDPTLMFKDFLTKYDPNLRYKQSAPFERGERPSAFSRGFKVLGF